MSQELSNLVDKYSETRAARLELQHATDALKAEENILSATIITKMQKADLTAIGGKIAIVKLKTTKEPTVEDWGMFYAHIQATGSFDLLHKRMGAGAVKLRWDDNKVVPGVTTFEVSKLTIGKAPK